MQEQNGKIKPKGLFVQQTFPESLLDGYCLLFDDAAPLRMMIPSRKHACDILSHIRRHNVNCFYAAGSCCLCRRKKLHFHCNFEEKMLLVHLDEDNHI